MASRRGSFDVEACAPGEMHARFYRCVRPSHAAASWSQFERSASPLAAARAVCKKRLIYQQISLHESRKGNVPTARSPRVAFETPVAASDFFFHAAENSHIVSALSSGFLGAFSRLFSNWDSKGATECESDGIKISNDYLVANFRFDRAENESLKARQKSGQK